jgi:hypothetical protein
VLLTKFRRERPGVFLEPGHLLELAGSVEVAPSSIPDIQEQLEADWKRQALDAAGVTEAEYAEHEHDAVWIRAKFSHLEVTDD